MFLPTTEKEVRKLGWKGLDVILITGDTYIDSPFCGIAVIGKILLQRGFKVGIIAQPSIDSNKDIMRLGEPSLFWGVSGGCVDSMVANYTALKKPRKGDDFTPGGLNTRRPDRAVIVYTNLIRRYFKNTVPIVLGGVEASLRRIAHYDYWSDKLRKSILFNAKADILTYGMCDSSIVAIAECLESGESWHELSGICFISREKPENAVELPSYDEVCSENKSFIEMFHLFYRSNDPDFKKQLCQKQDTRYLVQNPPAPYPSTEELDKIYEMDFERDVHPWYRRGGNVKAVETIRFSIPSHFGCFGECSFCGIAVHQGKKIRSRSEKSILNEVEKLTALSDFKGYISDISGPTGNMYGMGCKQYENMNCRKRLCLFPEKCANLDSGHSRLLSLLKKVRKINGIKKVFLSSGIRYDLILNDTKHGNEFLQELTQHHVSGQLKTAPEHSESYVLEIMKKPGIEKLIQFKNDFEKLSRQAKKKQFLTYYFIAAHPGCTVKGMEKLRSFASKILKINPRQVQIFTPLPSTYSSVMYYTEMNPFTGKKLFVEKNPVKKQQQKDILVPVSAQKKR